MPSPAHAKTTRRLPLSKIQSFPLLQRDARITRQATVPLFPRLPAAEPTKPFVVRLHLSPQNNFWEPTTSRHYKSLWYRRQPVAPTRGFLFAPNEQKLSPTLDFKRVAKLASHVSNAYDRSDITMVQRRHDDFDYEYWAIRTWCGLYFCQLKFLFFSWYAGLSLKWRLEYEFIW